VTRPIHAAAFPLALLLGLASTGAAHAQEVGHVVGEIYDQTGARLVDVDVTLRGPETRETPNGAEGGFQLLGLRPGQYELVATRDGFETVRRAIIVPAGKTVAVSLTMTVAALEQVVVTASRAGAEDVLAAPLAVTAVSAADLSRVAIRTLPDAAALMPAVTFTQNSSFGQLSIRGIGTNAVNAGSDPSSAMYLDGVYLARPAMVFADFFDLERVEVLRGPQGTLYGRNAVGGALNLVSRGPTDAFEAAARATAGSLHEWRGEARVSGPLLRDRVTGSLALVRGVRDGYVRDLDHPDHPLGGDDLTGARGQLRVLLGGRTDVLFSGDAGDQDGTILTFNKVLEVKPGFTIDNPPDLHAVRTSTPASSSLRQRGASARLTFRPTPETTLVSLSAYRSLENAFVVDADITELDVLVADNRERQHQWSQEVTVSHRGRRVTGVAGVFFFGEDDRQAVRANQPVQGLQVRLDPRVRATSAAGFGHASLAITPRVSLGAGVRYTAEGKDIDNAGGRYLLGGPTAPVPGSAYAYSDSIDHGAWTPRFVAETNLARDAMAYVSATRGFKSGGFNPSSTAPGRGYAPEWAWSYEAGLKTSLANGRARLGLAAFHMDYTDLQVQTPIGIGVFDIRNAAAANVRGVELEAGGRLGRGFDAGGHLSWLDARYDQYVAVAPGGVTGDVAGHRLNNAPEWSGRLWVEWTGNVAASRRLTLTVDATAQSTVYFTPFNDDVQRQRPYGLLNARAEFGPASRRWAVNAYGRNLTGSDYIMATFATSPVAFGGRPGPTRQLGVQLTARR
jgi:iron complex outermembrane receptor protein